MTIPLTDPFKYKTCECGTLRFWKTFWVDHASNVTQWEIYNPYSTNPWEGEVYADKYDAYTHGSAACAKTLSAWNKANAANIESAPNE